jgi:hypothetical protein
VNLFYKFFIPGVLVPMAVLVVMDFSRLMINRFRKKKPLMIHETTPAQQATNAETVPVSSEEKAQVEAEKTAVIPESAQTTEDEAHPVLGQTQLAEEEAAPEETQTGEDEVSPAPEESKNDGEEATHV